MPERADGLIILFASVAGLSGVILAALGSHLVSGLDDPVSFGSWQTANHMHLLHAVALLALSSMFRHSPARLIFIAAVCFVAGIMLFSGSIYLSLSTSLQEATRFAPPGGILLMLGWLLLGVHSVRVSRS